MGICLHSHIMKCKVRAWGYLTTYWKRREKGQKRTIAKGCKIDSLWNGQLWTLNIEKNALHWILLHDILQIKRLEKGLKETVESGN